MAQKIQSQFDGTENLKNYSAVVHFCGTDYGTDMPKAGQDALVAFVNSGGTYVATQWSSYMISQESFLKDMRDLILYDYVTSSSGAQTFSPVAAMAAHPLLDGIKSALTVNAGYVTGGTHTFATNPSISLMKDAAGNDWVLARTLGSGKVVNFAFNSTWDTTAPDSQNSVQKLILNAVNW